MQLPSRYLRWSLVMASRVSSSRTNRMAHVASSTHHGRVAVAMSGGIDSSTAALLLQRQGYDCVGVFMTNWDGGDEVGIGEHCSISKDKKDAKEVCYRLGIPFVEIDFIKEYWNEVFLPFLHSYQSGMETPNPDVYCNRHIKFDAFLKYATERLGVDCIATGHYARVLHEGDDSARLLAGVDVLKDQSYFLSLVQSRALRRVLFPLGDLHKSEVRQIAKEAFRGLSILDKKESMGLCFIGKRNMRAFLGNYLEFTPGSFIDAETHEVVGQHEGAEIYTIGQGARIGGAKERYFVVGNKGNGDLFVVRRSSHPMLMSSQLTVDEGMFSWVSGNKPEILGARGGKLRCQCKARYRQEPEWCHVEISEYENRQTMNVTFDNPQRAITAGQVLALYQDSVCLGGGIISGRS